MSVETFSPVKDLLTRICALHREVAAAVRGASAREGDPETKELLAVMAEIEAAQATHIAALLEDGRSPALQVMLQYAADSSLDEQMTLFRVVCAREESSAADVEDAARRVDEALTRFYEELAAWREAREVVELFEQLAAAQEAKRKRFTRAALERIADGP